MSNSNVNALTKTKPSKIFRYKFSDPIMQSITEFAKVHQFDDRHTYKEAWTLWLADQQDHVEREVSRLQQLDYKGDIIDKMFKAGRYYFREKAAIKKEEEPSAVKEKKQRDYIVMNPVIIQTMDTHLRGLMSNTNFKPALAYKQFCEQYASLLRAEVVRLTPLNFTDDKLSVKFKKTYKNRYFILQQN